MYPHVILFLPKKELHTFSDEKKAFSPFFPLITFATQIILNFKTLHNPFVHPGICYCVDFSSSVSGSFGLVTFHSYPTEVSQGSLALSVKFLNQMNYIFCNWPNHS